jgi:hypothetical protein
LAQRQLLLGSGKEIAFNWLPRYEQNIRHVCTKTNQQGK